MEYNIFCAVAEIQIFAGDACIVTIMVVAG
jgi:hypothetical protein